MDIQAVVAVAVSVILVIFVNLARKLVNRLWVRPKRIEKYLKEVGFSGNPYKFLHGDMAEFSRISEAAMSKPINFSHDVGARILPYQHHLVEKYGELYLCVSIYYIIIMYCFC